MAKKRKGTTKKSAETQCLLLLNTLILLHEAHEALLPICPQILQCFCSVLSKSQGSPKALFHKQTWAKHCVQSNMRSRKKFPRHSKKILLCKNSLPVWNLFLVAPGSSLVGSHKTPSYNK